MSGPGKVVGTSGNTREQLSVVANETSISKHGEQLWKHLSKDLRKNPSANWEAALANCLSLSKSLVGKEIPPQLLENILDNFEMLEKTLLGSKIGPKEKHDEIASKIQNDLLVCRIDVKTKPEGLEVMMEEVRKNSDQQQ
ncbi:hypothetical protein [Limnobacter parvus]|uniref:Uncharacterized protein n=1 Tax=Limnobacter parvus TaxID=2939690 RepID=A0ABT1XFY7_9BURK|nr:hypothetical protein [Limnobacter parvus]MCR2746181.1 hypothetical protein [Limnobacter parvus]